MRQMEAQMCESCSVCFKPPVQCICLTGPEVKEWSKGEIPGEGGQPPVQDAHCHQGNIHSRYQEWQTFRITTDMHDCSNSLYSVLPSSFQDFRRRDIISGEYSLSRKVHLMLHVHPRCVPGSYMSLALRNAEPGKHTATVQYLQR